MQGQTMVYGRTRLTWSATILNDFLVCPSLSVHVSVFSRPTTCDNSSSEKAKHPCNIDQHAMIRAGGC